MKFKYACVGDLNKQVIFAEYEFTEGDVLKNEARRIMESWEKNDNKTSTTTTTRRTEDGRYEFQFSQDEDGILFMIAYVVTENNEDAAVTQEEKTKQTHEQVLETVASYFNTRIGKARAKVATRRYAFHAEFSPILRRALEKANQETLIMDEDEESTGVKALQKKLDETTKSARSNITLMLDRGQKLANASRQSEELRDVSAQFKSNAATLKNMELWSLIKFRALMVILCILLVVIMYFSLAKKK